MRLRRKPETGSPDATRERDELRARKRVESATDVARDLDRSRNADDRAEDTEGTATAHEAIRRRTSQLPAMSKFLYRIDFYASLPVVAVSVVGALGVMLVVGIVIGFPSAWLVTFTVTVSSMTLLMVFTIQHTQGREQAATQRKLDELLLATPGAAGSLMMLEEAPREFMLEVEDNQRVARADIVDDGAPTSSSDPSGGSGPDD